MDTKSPYKKLVSLAWILGVSIITGIVILSIAYPKGFNSLEVVAFVIGYSVSLGLPIILISKFIGKNLDKKLPWLKNPLKRLVLTILLELLEGILVLIIMNIVFFMLIWGQSVTKMVETTYNGVLYLLVFTFIGIIIKNSYLFFKNWKLSAVNEEALKREKLALEYEALKNQVNPHFLFNNLTALSFLVYKDADKAAKFIDELAKIYRYVLQHKNQDIVELSSEANFIRSLAYLYKIRHNDDLIITINFANNAEKYIIPLALQLTVENAIKHNVISSAKPLKIHIFEEDGFILVKNNLQPKLMVSSSNKVGLENIKNRYKYVTGKEVKVIKNDREFVVKIPILTKQ